MPIPWRVAIFVDVWSDAFRSVPGPPGFDFYGRPTELIWFHIGRRRRAWIAFLNNVAWMANVAGAVLHSIYWSYSECFVMPSVGSISTFAALILGVVPAIVGGKLQGNAEKKLRAEQPGRFPPSLPEELDKAFRRWRRGEEEGSLCDVLRREARKANDTGGGLVAGVSKPAFKVSRSKRALRGGADGTPSLQDGVENTADSGLPQAQEQLRMPSPRPLPATSTGSLRFQLSAAALEVERPGEDAPVEKQQATANAKQVRLESARASQLAACGGESLLEA